MDNFDDAEMKCWGGSGLEPANTGGKWLQLLVHVSLCSMLFVIARGPGPGAVDNTSAHCDSAADLSHLRSFRARACQPGDSRQKLSIYQDLDTVYVYVLYRTHSKALIHTQINEK